MNIDIRFLLIFLILWLLQGIGIYYQNRGIRLKINELGRNGHLFIGVDKKPFGSAVYAILVENENKVVDAEYLRGITIFTKFKKINQLIGLDIEDFKVEINRNLESRGTRKVYKAFNDALKKYEIFRIGKIK